MAELKRKTITGEDGHYSFRNMPSGVFTIWVNQQQYCEVSLGAGPQLLRQDVKLSPTALAVARR